MLMTTEQANRLGVQWAQSEESQEYRDRFIAAFVDNDFHGAALDVSQRLPIVDVLKAMCWPHGVTLDQIDELIKACVAGVADSWREAALNAKVRSDLNRARG